MCKKIIELKNKSPDELLKMTNQVGVFPVDVAQICYNVGIRLMPFNFSPIEEEEEMRSTVEKRGTILGAAVVKGNELAILYRKDDSSNRRRFTIAHELAHVCLHMEADDKVHIEFRTDRSTACEKEKKANIFAGELLIPKDVLTELIGESKYVAQSVIPQLCDLFMVSKNVMVERLKCLGIKVFE